MSYIHCTHGELYNEILTFDRSDEEKVINILDALMEGGLIRSNSDSYVDMDIVEETEDSLKRLEKKVFWKETLNVKELKRENRFRRLRDILLERM